MKAARILIILILSTQVFVLSFADDPRIDPLLRVKEPEVILESAGEERPETFGVPESIAFQSPVIKNAVTRAQGIGEPVRYLKFDDISGGNLNLFIQTLQVLRNMHDVDPLAPEAQIMGRIEKEVRFPQEMSLQQLKELINQAAYLQLPALVQVVARFIARAIHDGDMNREDLQDISQELVAQIARHYYLIYNQTIEGVTIQYGVSIRELLLLNRLPAIPEYWEYDLSNLKINNLDGLQDIPDIGKVISLNLSHNEIAEVKDGDFIGLGNLGTLILSYNRLTKLPARAFRGMGSLNKLNVSHNWINSIDSAAFSGLGGLTHLDLSSNAVDGLAEQLFSGMGNLEVLNLSDNGLKTLTFKSFKDLSSLKDLNLQDNDIKKLGNSIFAELVNLQNLNLSYNQIQEISNKTFAGLSMLRKLNLSVNRIRDLPRTIFSELKLLSSLNLASNQLWTLDVYLFKDLLHLIEIDLTHNWLNGNDLATGVFTGPKNLEIVRIGFNYIKEVPEEFFRALKHLRRLIILGNPMPAQKVAQLEYRYKHIAIIYYEVNPGAVLKGKKML